MIKRCVRIQPASTGEGGASWREAVGSRRLRKTALMAAPPAGGGAIACENTTPKDV
jgi:hypothetical protein